MPRAENLILHAGLGKTGTSTLQHWCFEHGDLLRRRGIRYAAPGDDPRTPKQQYLVDALFNGDMSRIARELQLDSPCATLLFSSEGLTHHLFDFDADALAAFRAMTRNLRLTVFLVVRDYDVWAKSYYKQVILNPVFADPNHAEQLYGTALPFSEFRDLPIVHRYRDQHGLLDALKRSFAPDRLVVAAYECDWFGSFCQLLGLPDGTDPGATRHNTGVPDWLAEIVRQLNALRLGETERQALLGLIGTLPSVRGTNLSVACGAARRPAHPDGVERFLAALEPIGWCNAAQLRDFRDNLRKTYSKATDR